MPKATQSKSNTTVGSSRKSTASGGLVIKKPELRKRTAALFGQLESDAARRESFIRNPIGLLATEVMGKALNPQHESDANRLLLSMLSNERFSKWLQAYPSSNNGKRVTREQFRKDFSAALIEFGDPTLVNAALKNAAHGFDLIGPVAEQFVTGPEKTLFTSPATPSTSNQTAHSSSNANGFNFGEAVIQPELLRSLVEQLVARARSLRDAGDLANFDQPIH